jgi:hypothetical protein
MRRPPLKSPKASAELLGHCGLPDWYNGHIMTSPDKSPSILQICADVKKLGYAAPSQVRLYGEEFEVVSDPFPEADGVAIHAKTKKDATIRVVRLPTTVLQGVKGRYSRSVA